MEIIKIAAISIAIMDLIALIALCIFISRQKEIKKLNSEMDYFQRIARRNESMIFGLANYFDIYWNINDCGEWTKKEDIKPSGIRINEDESSNPKQPRKFLKENEIFELLSNGVIFVRYSDYHFKEIADRIARVQETLHSSGCSLDIKIFGLHKDIQLEKLSDDELKNLNLQRIKKQ